MNELLQKRQIAIGNFQKLGNIDGSNVIMFSYACPEDGLKAIPTLPCLMGHPEVLSLSIHCTTQQIDYQVIGGNREMDQL